MTTTTENRCLRCRTDCTPAANITSDGDKSFICVGWNRPAERVVPGDRFTLCWKNGAIDERGHWDKRDLMDTMSVIAQALSTDENIRVGEGLDETGMQSINLLL
jgi:hypothetical protein